MSKRIECPDCGEQMDVPAFPGDGAYTSHHCDLDNLCMHQRERKIAEGDWSDVAPLPCEKVPWR
jgi:hypothetical protein